MFYICPMYFLLCIFQGHQCNGRFVRNKFIKIPPFYPTNIREKGRSGQEEVFEENKSPKFLPHRGEGTNHSQASLHALMIGIPVGMPNTVCTPSSCLCLNSCLVKAPHHNFRIPSAQCLLAVLWF